MRKSFTLIELLVVIAIIGILAGVILVSLNAARAKAKDTRVKAELTQVRNAIESYMTTNGSYANLACSPDKTKCEDFFGNADPDINNIGKLAKDIKNLIGTATNVYNNELVIVATPSAYKSFAGIPSVIAGGTKKHYCVDSAGKTSETTTVLDSTNNMSLYFNNTTDYMPIPTTDPIGNGAVTICAWIYQANDPSAIGKIIDNGKTSLYRNYDSVVPANTNTLVFTSDGLATVHTTTQLPTAQWTYVRGSRASASPYNIKLYINGAETQLGTAGTPGSVSPTNIGNAASGIGQPFKGYIGDVEIYNTQITADNILYLYNRSGLTNPGLPTHKWLFNAGTGTGPISDSGNSTIPSGNIVGATWQTLSTTCP